MEFLRGKLAHHGGTEYTEEIKEQEQGISVCSVPPW